MTNIFLHVFNTLIFYMVALKFFQTNINGKLIRILSEENGTIEGSRAIWDGRDLNNNLVSSGIYIYLVYSEEGEVSKGKLSVIRK